MILPLLFLVLAIAAVVIASILGFIGSVTSVDLSSLIGALVLVLGAFVVAIVAVFYSQPEGSESGDSAAER